MAFDLHLARGFFDAETCRRLLAELRVCPAAPATVYGRADSAAVDERTRKTMRLRPSAETEELVRRRLLDYRERLVEHFGMALNDCEEAQFLRYDVGGFFVAHQDGNTGMLRLRSDQWRKVSVVIFLNNQSETPREDAYCGGTLLFSDWRDGRKELALPGEAGMLCAFRAETTHEVQPVTQGERYSIASWYG